MDAMQHTVWVGTFTVLGAYGQSSGTVPVLSSAVSPFVGQYVGGFADVLIGGSGFVLTEKYFPDGEGWKGMVKDAAEAGFLGYAISAGLTLLGL